MKDLSSRAFTHSTCSQNEYSILIKDYTVYFFTKPRRESVLGAWSECMLEALGSHLLSTNRDSDYVSFCQIYSTYQIIWATEQEVSTVNYEIHFS